MKLRIHDNAIRLRLSKSDLAHLIAEGRVESAIHFGPGPHDQMIYALAINPEAQHLRASFSANKITLEVPPKMAHAWPGNDQIGYESTQNLGVKGNLTILIEKDFACIDTQNPQENVDTFPNPKASSTC